MVAGAALPLMLLLAAGASPRAAAAAEEADRGEGLLLVGARGLARRVVTDGQARHVGGGTVSYSGHAHVDDGSWSRRFELGLAAGAANTGFIWDTTLDIAVGGRWAAAAAPAHAFVLRGGGRLEHAGLPIAGDLLLALPAIDIAYDVRGPRSFVELLATAAPALRIPYVSGPRSWEGHFGYAARAGAHAHYGGADLDLSYRHRWLGDYGRSHGVTARFCLVLSGVVGCADAGYERGRLRRTADGAFLPGRAFEVGLTFGFGRGGVF